MTVLDDGRRQGQVLLGSATVAGEIVASNRKPFPCLRAAVMQIKNVVSLQKNNRWRFAQWLERRWWQRYLRHQSAAEYLRAKKLYWQKILSSIGYEPLAGQKVLDAGCGPAGIFIYLHEQQIVTALDPLLAAYEQDLAIFQKAMYPCVQFVVAPMESAQLPSASFQTIYCFNAINHVADWEGALDQLGRWLAPAGDLLLSSDVHRWQLLRWLFRLLPGDALHPQQHSAREYEAALAALGWQIKQRHRLRRTFIFDYVLWQATKAS